MERGTFAEIDHTADLGLDLSGPSPEAVLEAAQRGLIQVLMGEIQESGPLQERTVILSADSYPDLLKAWCEAVYDLLESERFVAVETNVASAEPDRFCAVVRGLVVSPARAMEASELKAVTYHQLKFGGTDEWWQARVIFDV